MSLTQGPACAQFGPASEIMRLYAAALAHITLSQLEQDPCPTAVLAQCATERVQSLMLMYAMSSVNESAPDADQRCVVLIPRPSLLLLLCVSLTTLPLSHRSAMSRGAVECVPSAAAQVSLHLPRCIILSRPPSR